MRIDASNVTFCLALLWLRTSRQDTEATPFATIFMIKFPFRKIHPLARAQPRCTSTGRSGCHEIKTYTVYVNTLKKIEQSQHKLYKLLPTATPPA